MGVVILADGANLQGDILKSLTKEEREAALKACATARDELIKQATKDLAACIKKHGNQEGNSNYEGCKKDYKDSNEQAWAAYRANEELYKQK